MDSVIWIGAPDDVRTGDDALNAIRVENDAYYYDQSNGVTKVPRERWLKAQGYESRGWLHCWSDQKEDRADEHYDLFDGYKSLKQNLGNVCEIGCGPFTQLSRIIIGRSAEKITLLDPLIKAYRKLKHCSYRDGKFMNYNTTLRSDMAENLIDLATFDTLICINVIEHVMDAPKVLANLHRALKAGGTIIFGEKSYDKYDPHTIFDMGHPIHLKKPLLTAFKNNFTPTYCNNEYFIGTK